MLNFGLFEIVIIMGLALVVVGPERLPEMVRFLGRQYGKLVRASDELKRAFMMEADRADAEKRAEALRERRAEARKRAEAARKRALEAMERGERPQIEPVPSDAVEIDNAARDRSPEATRRATEALDAIAPGHQDPNPEADSGPSSPEVSADHADNEADGLGGQP